MKYIFISGVAMILCYNTASQNVGIGTAAPQTKLHVVSDDSYGITHEYNGVRLSTYIDANGGWIGTVTNHPINFYTNNGMQQMAILTNGNVGIATATPQYILDVKGRMRVKTGIVGNIFTTSGIWFEDYRDGDNRIFFGMQDSIRVGIYGEGSPGVAWAFNFNARNGKVGIGRVAESYQLEVASEYGIGLYKNFGNSFYGSLSSNEDTALVIAAAYGSIFGGVPAKNILLNPYPGFPLYSGRVAVGTASPTAKFHVDGNTMIGSGNPATGYMLSVNGKIICTEAKVQVNGSWPDYVFTDNYRLMPLEELEKFIRVKNHLPNIPAAIDIEKNGMELGEMVKRLIEKVEELTLYVIDLKKENEKFKNK
jgi:hypothetical protein